MRRVVLVFMMLLLPVQWTWAAAATYCQHETGAAAQHLGHHEHKHQGAGGDKGSQSSSKSFSDNDCGVCHLSGLHWLDLTQGPLMVVSMPPQQLEPRLLFRSFVPSGPERPDRPRIA